MPDLPEQKAPSETAKPSQRFSYSADIGELIGALAKAQLEFEAIKKETENPAYARGGKAMKYADLSTIIEATQPALAKNGLAILQSPDVDIHDQSMTLTGLMAHASGQWIRCETTLPAVQRERFDPQSCGSSITYARRYQYKSLIGAAEEDDDANAASGVGSVKAAKAVGEAKVAALKEKAAKSPETNVKTLFWTAPDKFNGHRAVFMNLKEFGAGLNEVEANGLKSILKKYMKGGDEEGSAFVPTGVPMDTLLVELEQCGVLTKKLASNG